MDEIIDIDDLRKLKLPELKAMCKQNGIPSTGPKEVLIKRLCVSMGMDEEDEGVEDEDALLEGEDKEDEEEEEEEEEEEDARISSSDDKEESVEPTESNETTSDSVVGGGKEESTPLESPTKEDPPIVDKDKENETGVSPSKKIKLIEAPPADPPKPVSQLTDAERLKLRAEKYGVNTAKGALSSKEARAARFGTGASEKKASPTAAAAGAKVAAVPKNVSAEDLEKMKQRGARFGATVSSTLSSVDNVDKILKRKERFGEVAATTTSATTSEAAAKEKRAARFGASKITAPTTTSTTTSTEADELKKKRAERFKIPV